MISGLLLGVVLVAVSIASTRFWCGRGRDEAATVRLEMMWWAVYLVFAALIYVGFALREGGDDWMPLELAGLGFYSALAVAGYKLRRDWLIAGGWALHAIWDAVVHRSAPAGLVPEWYRWACLSFDVVVTIYLLRRSRATTAVLNPR